MCRGEKSLCGARAFPVLIVARSQVYFRGAGVVNYTPGLSGVISLYATVVSQAPFIGNMGEVAVLSSLIQSFDVMSREFHYSGLLV